MPGPKNYYQELKEIARSFTTLYKSLEDGPMRENAAAVCSTLVSIYENIDELSIEECEKDLMEIKTLSNSLTNYLKTHTDSSPLTNTVKKLSILMDMDVFKTASEFLEQRKAYGEELTSGQAEEKLNAAYLELEAQKNQAFPI